MNNEYTTKEVNVFNVKVEQNTSIDSDDTERTSLDYTRHSKTNNNQAKLKSEMEDIKQETINLKAHFTIWKIFLHNILHFLAVFFYLLSLQGCKEERYLCHLIYHQHHVKWLIFYIVISAFLYSLHIFTVFTQGFSKSSLVLSGSVCFFVCFIYDSGFNYHSHGGYNRIALFFFVMLFNFASLILYCLYKGLSKNFMLTILLTLISLLGLTIVFISVSENSCDKWDRGLKDTVQPIDDRLCHVTKPETCYFTFFSIDYVSWTRKNKNCKKFNKDVSLTRKKMINSNVNLVGFPRTENYNFYYSMFGAIQSYVMRSTVDMLRSDFSSSYLESIESSIDLTTKTVLINLKKNETLELERNEINKKMTTKPIAKNVLIITVDSLSRFQLRKKLPKVWEWLEKHFDVDEKKLNKGKEDSNWYSNIMDLHSEIYQFPNFHALGKTSAINMVPALFGVRYSDVNGTYYVKHFKDNGYITGSSVNWCGREVFENLIPNQLYLNWEGYDHELSSIFCDPNFTPIMDSYPLFNGPYAVTRRCLYEKQTIEYSIDYLKQFWEKYSTSSKLFRLGIVDGIDSSGQVIKYDDEYLYELLTFFDEKGYFKDTVLIFHSDHGNSMPNPFNFFQTFDYMQEMSQPFLYIMIPKNSGKDENTKVKEILKKNEWKLITPYDLYHTILTTMGETVKYERKSDIGGSIFFEKFDNYKRDCRYFHIDEHFCKCLR